MHYYRNSSVLKDGDLVLMDYAPDYRYYVSDIGRVWPVDGRYNAWQRELLQFVLDYRNAVLSRIRPGTSAAEIQEQARQAMQPRLAPGRFSKPAYLRYEDTVVVTESGVENFTAFLPSELPEIEALVREKGIVQSRPALTPEMFERLGAGSGRAIPYHSREEGTER